MVREGARMIRRLLHQLRQRARLAELPERRPKLAPVRYGKDELGTSTGVVFKNQGEDAYEVVVPDLVVAFSRVCFEGGINYLASKDELFCAAYIEGPDGIQSADSTLLDFMRRNMVGKIEPSIYYRDFDARWYVTHFALHLNPMGEHGISVGTFRQLAASGPPSR
jgi:hypothetical protein